MAIEAALIKPVVDALLGLFRQGENLHLKRNAETALREAIRELLLANPNESKAEARIAIAKAAGIISEDVVLAEKMLNSHRANAARTRGKGGGGKPRKAAGKADDKAEAKEDTAAKKAAAKTPARKVAKKS
jgi:hypothetical protein